MSVQEMLKRFEETRVSDNTGPPSAPPAPAATRPRAPVTRRTVSFRTTAGPVQPRLRHRNSEGRIGLTRSRPVSAHVSPLLRERPAVLRRNAALKARVSERVGDLERRPSAERAPGAVAATENGSPSPPVVKKAGQTNGEVPAGGLTHRPLARAVALNAASAGTRPGTAAPATRAAVVSVPVSPPAAADIDNNNEPLKTGGAHRHTVAAAEELTGEDFSSLPLPPGPPPRKPPRTFAHDVYVQTKQSAGAAGAEAGVAAVSKAGVKAGAGVASGAGKAASAGQGAGAGEVGVEAAAAANGVSTTVVIRRSTSGTRPAVARKPSDLGRRMSSRLETFQPLPSAATAGADAKSPAEHVYAEPTVSRRDRPPPPSPPPPPPPPGRNRRPGPGNARRGPVEPYAVSPPLRRSASDETLYGTLSREHVYELLPNAKTRPVSISSSAGSPPGLRRHPAFKRQERPSLRRIAPGRPPPPAFAREPEGRMGCLLTAVSAEGDADTADPAPAGRRSDRWTAGPLALRRRNYLRRVSTQMGGSRPRVSVGSAERLFDALLVVALSADSEGRLEPCVVSRYPPDVSLEADVAPFCFPDAERWQRAPDVWGRSAADGGAAYTLVVTDERGGRSYGYCRRLTADTGGGAVTLPIAYCLLTRHDAPAFYSKLLSALLEHHGTSEQHRLRVLDELYGRPFPLPGGSLSVPAASCADGQSEKQDSNGGSTPEQKPRLVRRPLDPRLEEDGLYLLVRRLGVDLFIKLFSSALLERKIVLYSAHLGVLSAAVSALQAALCPFVWQHCLIPVVPSRLAELLAVPSPFIMGALPETRPLEHLNEQEDVICVDLDAPSLVQSVGDEATILPRRLGRTLAEALRLAACLPGGEPAPGVASVMLAETLLRLFVEVCGHYRVHLTTQQDGRPVLQREAFVESAPSDDVREFLEWFTETAMFAAFIESCDQVPEAPAVSLFDRRVMEQHGDEQAGCHRILRGTKHLKALGGRFKFRLPS